MAEQGRRSLMYPWQQLCIRLLLLSLFSAKKLASIIPSANKAKEAAPWEGCGAAGGGEVARTAPPAPP